MTTTITGLDAIAYATARGIALHKHADPIEGAREVTADEAREIAREDVGLIYCEAPETITDARLDEIAPTLDRAARELAHMRVAPCDAATYAREYVLCVAETCGARSADQCAPGEAWEPESWLAGDEEALTEAASLVGVTLTREIRAEAWERYVSPSAAARSEVA